MAIYAAIDVGTNTLRLLVAEAIAPDDFTILHEEQEITRLGEGLMATRLLQAEPRRRSLTVLRRFAETVRSFKADRVAAVATSAAREARNRQEWIAEIAQGTGLTVRVIDGTEEARLTLLGVRHGLRQIEIVHRRLDVERVAIRIRIALVVDSRLRTGLRTQQEDPSHQGKESSRAHSHVDPPRPEMTGPLKPPSR